MNKFTVAQRRMFHNRGSRQLASAYSTVIGAQNKAQRLVSDDVPKNITYSHHYLLENNTYNFSPLGQKPYQDCPESIGMVPFPPGTVAQWHQEATYDVPLCPTDNYMQFMELNVLYPEVGHMGKSERGNYPGFISLSTSCLLVLRGFTTA